MLTSVTCGLAMVLALVATAPSARAEVTDYVLALSWSPTYCAGRPVSSSPLQCDLDADRTFVVHGLWPNIDGRPHNDCRINVRPRFPSDDTVSAMLDVMPDRGLVEHQWRKHGSCSGLTPRAYFGLVREAAERVAIPPGLLTISSPLKVTPAVLRAAFQTMNPEIPDDGISVACRDDDLVEIRLCLNADLEFFSCPRPPRRCRARILEVMPPR